MDTSDLEIDLGLVRNKIFTIESNLAGVKKRVSSEIYATLSEQADRDLARLRTEEKGYLSQLERIRDPQAVDNTCSEPLKTEKSGDYRDTHEGKYKRWDRMWWEEDGDDDGEGWKRG